MSDAADRAATGADAVAAEIGVRRIGDGGEARDDGGILRGDVGGFADVGGKVVEFAAGEVEFPRAGADGLEEEAAVAEALAEIERGEGISLEDLEAELDR